MKSFFEKLTGVVNIEDLEEEQNEDQEIKDERKLEINDEKKEIDTEVSDKDWMMSEIEESELTVDVYQEPENIIIKTMIAGVDPHDLDVSISRDMVTIKGKREEERMVDEDDYFAKELYWGSFSRTVSLPTEIDIEEAEASEKHGMLTLKLPKVDKGRQTKLKVKSK